MTMLKDLEIEALIRSGFLGDSDAWFGDEIHISRAVLDVRHPLASVMQAAWLEEYARVGPASLDLCLGDEFIKQRAGRSISVRDESANECWYPAVTLEEGEEITICPGDFILAETVQVVHMPDDVSGMVAARSTYGRIGLQVCGNAGFVDPGFHGSITLELHNVGACPIRLIRGERVMQLIMWRTDGPCARPYGSASLGSQYQGQRGPTRPMNRVRK